MVNLATNLGRDVPTPREILEVIRPQLRFAAIIGPAVESVFTVNRDDGPDWMIPEDESARDVVFDALRDDAAGSVKMWARDCDKVFDQAKMTALIAEALNECLNGDPSNAVIDVLALDEGVSESLGLAITALGQTYGVDHPLGARLRGVGACYFHKV